MKKVEVISIGNVLKGDDDIANLVVERLKKQFKDPDYTFVQAGITPENFLLKIKKQDPKIVYFVDAAQFEGEVGDVRLFGLDDIEELEISTHNIPLSFFQDHLKNIRLIGIKIKEADFRSGLSPQMKEKFNTIVSEVKEIILK